MSSSNSKVSRASGEAARSRLAVILANTLALGSNTATSSESLSNCTNPVQESIESGNRDLCPEPASPSANLRDCKRANQLPLSVTPGSEMALPMDNLRRWCAVTHSPWKDSKGNLLLCNCVQEAHVVDKKLDIVQKARLEVAWGLKPGQFDFNGPLNTIPLQVDWRMRFDKQDWVLLPPIGVLARIYDAFQDHLCRFGPRKAPDEGVPLVKNNTFEYKIYQYEFVPFGSSSASAELLRLKFKEGKEYEKLAKREFESYTPDAYIEWPAIRSTAHPYPVIWKAVKEFGFHTPLSNLILPRHMVRMTMAQEIYVLWQEYANEHRELWSYVDPDGSSLPPSNRDHRQPFHFSLGKRKRGHQDGGGDEKRSRKRPHPKEYFTGSPGDIVDDPLGMFSSSMDDHAPSFSCLQPLSPVDHSVCVAAGEESESGSEDEGRPIALQPKRQFNIFDWAKTALQHGEPVAEDHYSPDSQFFEEPRKPPSGPWEDWPPAYA